MVRTGRLAAALAVAALPTSPAIANAQSLQRLTVRAFALSSDAARPRPGIPFRLIVTLRVREPVTRVDNLELPFLAQVDLLGDERTISQTGAGTIYRETIAIAARRSGELAIGPASLQAIDPRDGRAKAYWTNPLSLEVAGSPAGTGGGGSRIASLWAGAIALLVVLAILLVRRRKARLTIEAVEPAIVPPPAPQPASDPLQDALLVLRTERSRPTALRVRAIAYRVAGATNGETLADVLQRPAGRNPSMRALLIALERASFTDDLDLPAALDDACAALERVVT